jgi:hypothetical protein
MMLVAEEEGKRRRHEQGLPLIGDASAALEAHLVALETTPPAVQLILDELDLKSAEEATPPAAQPNPDELDQPILDERNSAEGHPTGQVDRLPTGAIDQKRSNSPLEDDASPSKRLKGLALQGPEDQRAASEERPTRAASTAAVARLHTHFGPQRVPHAAATAARLKTRPAATHVAPAVASSTATTTAEERAQTAAASAAAPHPDV